MIWNSCGSQRRCFRDRALLKGRMLRGREKGCEQPRACRRDAAVEGQALERSELRRQQAHGRRGEVMEDEQVEAGKKTTEGKYVRKGMKVTARE